MFISFAGSDDNANVWSNTRSRAAENAGDRRLRTEPWQAEIRMWDSSCEASALRRASSQIRLPLEKDIDSKQSILNIAASQDGQSRMSSYPVTKSLRDWENPSHVGVRFRGHGFAGLFRPAALKSR
jgi:hypothetical protein